MVGRNHNTKYMISTSIKKQKIMPDTGERYEWISLGDAEVKSDIWHGKVNDFKRLQAGNIFRTSGEADIRLNEILNYMQHERIQI